MDDLVWQILLAGFAIFVVFKISLITYRRGLPGAPLQMGRDRYRRFVIPGGVHLGTATAAHQIEGNRATTGRTSKKELARREAARHATIGISGGTTSISCPR